MGLRPSRPVVTAAAAAEGLRARAALQPTEVDAMFREIADAGGAGAALKDRRLTLNGFRICMPVAAPFFEMGELVTQRLFQVLGGDSEGLGPEQFLCAVYLFTCASDEERYRLLFNMFDLHGGGFVRKKEFRAMCMAVVKGSHELPDSFDTDFKALERTMTDAGMQLYDLNKDGKLSFEEWCAYAKDDTSIMGCYNALSMGSSSELLVQLRGATPQPMGIGGLAA